MWPPKQSLASTATRSFAFADNSFDAQRHQRLSPDGHARAVCDEPRWSLSQKGAATVNKGGTPTVALFISAAIAVLFIVFGKTFEKVITVLAFFFVANYALSFISVFVLRRREPEKERPYRAWGYPWTTALALIGSVAFSGRGGRERSGIAHRIEDSIYAVLLLAASYPVFRVVKFLAPSQRS